MLIVDTGVLVAAADRNDPDYHACSELLETDDGPLVTTAMVVAEAAHLIDRQVGALDRILPTSTSKEPPSPRATRRRPSPGTMPARTWIDDDLECELELVG